MLSFNLFEIVPLYIYDSVDIPRNQSLRLMLTNVYSGNDNFEELADYVLELDPDILLMEEINSSWINNMSRIRGHYPFRKEVPRDDNFGIVLFSKYSLSNILVKSFVRGGVPSIVCDVDVNGKLVHFVGTHPLPPVGGVYSAERNEQLQLIGEYCASITDKPVILLGDLNTPPWSHYFNSLVETSKLKNSSKGFGIQASWPALDLMVFLSNPIDHCLVSHSITVDDRFIGKYISSDHFPVIVDLSL